MGNYHSVLPDDDERLKSVLGQKAEFSINGQIYKVGDEVGDMKLNTFIREKANLKGTKFMCLEGGCGVCIVSAKFTHPVTHKKVTYSVNSCLVPVLICQGWEITTTEGIGNKFKGYHKVQKRLAGANGTQCGYCSPGMVMNMYSLLEKNPNMTMKEIENSFAGNICRCTGYRPILDAMKSFASDAPADLVNKLKDIEDIVCPNSGQLCSGACQSNCDDVCIETLDIEKPLAFNFENGSQWYRPISLQEIFEIYEMIGDKSYRLVGGNTGHGVYRVNPKPQVYIDINGIAELHVCSVASNGLKLGANMSLTETMDFLYKVAKEQPKKFSFCANMADHMDLVASVPVRNIGTLAGNLSLKHDHREFQSDIFLILETVGAKVIIHDLRGTEECIDLIEYLDTNMNKKVMTQILIPSLDNNQYIFQSYKIMPRHQNAHAMVNAGFMFRVNKAAKYKVVEKPSIVYGSISKNFVHASNTENFLMGKCLMDSLVVQQAVNILSTEINPDEAPPEPSRQYRRGLAVSLFYKFLLSLNPESVNPKFRSGGTILERPVSSGKQDFDTRKEVWPLNQFVPKIEGIIQCAGEAEYTNDIPNFPDQLWGQLVLCDRAGTEIINIDPSPALSMAGVFAFYQAKDIPGVNTFCPPRTIFFTQNEKVFAEGKTDYTGQAVGIIVAESFELATEAAGKVKINYGKSDVIMTDAKQIVKNNVTSRIKEFSKIEPTATKDNIKYKVSGEFNVPSQYQYCMEPLSCVAVPTEDKLDVYPSSQWPCVLQDVMSHALNIPENQLNVRVRRLGGAYGAKITLPNQTAIACSLAALKLHRPVRTVLQLETNMAWGGKRFPVFTNYEAGVDEKGEIQYLQMKIYQDNGYSANDTALGMTMQHLPSCYDRSVWSVTAYGVTTDTASNTWCRAPGSVEGTAIIENLMEHIAKVTKLDETQVRLANMVKDHPCIQLTDEMKRSADYEARLKQVQDFNEANRWKKKGISLTLMDYPFATYGPFHGSVSIYRFDGTVSISHGAVEMGQGCNTKAAQTAAFILGVDLDIIKVEPVTNFVSPNNFVTGGSMGSESACFAIQKSCEQINERLKPVKDKLGPNAKWLDVITEAFNQRINLRASYMFTPNDIKPYNIYGACVTEVECDILTGQYEARRVDLIEDAGESLSPGIDIGQVEGSIVMGFGLYTTEELIYDKKGKLLTDRTWSYKPPGVKDIPIDFRVTLRKNSSNPLGVLRSKTTGEPPFCLSISLVFAIRKALESARREAGNDEWPQLELPLTRERMWLGALTTKEMFTL